jgi:CheY-like chemotaxis protein
MNDGSTINRKNILVAEDNADDAFLLKRAFVQARINVRLDFVQDGEEVIHYLKGENGFADRTAHPFPALLLLDLKMPRLDGFDVLNWLRQQSGGLKRLPVTVLTSSDQPSDVNRAYDLGANSYLIKPTVSESLMEVVQRIQNYWFNVNHPPDCA